MKLTNFKLIKTTGENALDWEYFATVDITTGFLWWKKTESREIYRKYAEYWCFTETGKYTPMGQAEELARAWEAKTGQSC